MSSWRELVIAFWNVVSKIRGSGDSSEMNGDSLMPISAPRSTVWLCTTIIADSCMQAARRTSLSIAKVDGDEGGWGGWVCGARSRVGLEGSGGALTMPCMPLRRYSMNAYEPTDGRRKTIVM